MATKENDDTIGIESGVKIIEDNSSIVIFKSSLVEHAASPLLRLPANFVGVRSVRQAFKTPKSFQQLPTSNSTLESNDANNKKSSHLGTSKGIKFCVLDENGKERRMTKSEKKAKKLQIAYAKKEAKKEAAARRKRKVENDHVNNGDTALKFVADDGAIERQKEDVTSEGVTAISSGPYHQLPLNLTTMEQELAEFQGKRGSTPPVILSPPMALQFVSKNRTFKTVKESHSSMNNTSCHLRSDNAILSYDHILSQEWADRLKQQCVLPAEAVRQKEDIRPLAYRLQPEPWQRLKPSLEANPVATICRNKSKMVHKSLLPSSPTTAFDVNPKTLDWVPLTCRPRMTSVSRQSNHLEQTASIQHDDIVSIVFEYIHRETPYYVSCGAKFGSDFLVYDGPRDERHAFAGLRVLSRFTSSMTTRSSKPAPELEQVPPQEDTSIQKASPSADIVELPLPTAYSLTGFVRCLNTAGKLALLATVNEVSDNNSGEKCNSFGPAKTQYQVAFVDVALEKVLHVHKSKKRGRSVEMKLQKRRDVTQTLSKI